MSRQDRIEFTALTGWSGRCICAEARYTEGGGGGGGTTAGRASSSARNSVRWAGPIWWKLPGKPLRPVSTWVIACAFNYDSQAGEFSQFGRIRVIKARMNADLHMAEDLKSTDRANLFVVFGEPDIAVEETEEGELRVRIRGVDVFDPSTGEVRSDETDGIACWFIDTDYNGESFFVRHAYFLGANDPYTALKTTLKAEIDPEAWASLRRAVSRPFRRPEGGRIAVKVINYLGDEVMKVTKV